MASVFLLCLGWLLVLSFPFFLSVHAHADHGEAKPQICDDGKTNVETDFMMANASMWTCQGPYMRLPRRKAVIQNQCYPADASGHYCVGESFNYSTDPPLSGRHREVWPVYGEYHYLNAPRYIHGLEHGAILMLYDPCAPPDVVDKLRKIVTGCLRRHLITPYLNLGSPIALLSWGCILRLNSVTEKVVKAWIKEHAFKTGKESSVFRDGSYTYALKNVAEVVSDMRDSELCPSSRGVSHPELSASALPTVQTQATAPTPNDSRAVTQMPLDHHMLEATTESDSRVVTHMLLDHHVSEATTDTPHVASPLATAGTAEAFNDTLSSTAQVITTMSTTTGAISSAQQEHLTDTALAATGIPLRHIWNTNTSASSLVTTPKHRKHHKKPHVTTTTSRPATSSIPVIDPTLSSQSVSYANGGPGFPADIAVTGTVVADQKTATPGSMTTRLTAMPVSTSPSTDSTETEQHMASVATGNSTISVGVNVTFHSMQNVTNSSDADDSIVRHCRTHTLRHCLHKIAKSKLVWVAVAIIFVVLLLVAGVMCIVADCCCCCRRSYHNSFYYEQTGDDSKPLHQQFRQLSTHFSLGKRKQGKRPLNGDYSQLLQEEDDDRV